ncbi:Fanconi anemia group D2 protein [Polypterus senegalus]|uniref:Fanconi anemia group D2 protein n=1 Tax=Polypterus senegalus TaxID=55291 RepID=UPI00196260A3|nr:Fanconi anemia group D2 protein [Polypterus senegalus]
MKKKRSSLTENQDDSRLSESSRPKKSRIGGRKSKSFVQEAADDSVFGQMLRSAGVILQQAGAPVEIASDQAVFQKKIYQCLRKHPRYPSVVQEFITGLESHMEDKENLRSCLLPCVLRVLDGESSANNSYHESLLKLLLGIDILQPKVINTLFEKLPEFMFDGVGEDGLNMPRLIINQFKWLDRVVDCKDLASKLMQLVAVAPVEIQRDIITSLPEILEDTQHDDISKELNCLLQTNPPLTVPILDALSSLRLSVTLLTEVRQAVMMRLSAMSLEDLPVVVKFILHSITGSEAVEVISDLRKKLDLESCILPSQLQTSQGRENRKGPVRSSLKSLSSNNGDCVTLVLDVIKSSIRFQKTISDAWIKAIENVDSAAEHKVIDLLVLLILHVVNANNSRRGAEKVLRNKVRGGQIRESLLRAAVRDHAVVVRAYFPSILSLAQSLLCSADPSTVTFGSLMYREAFNYFDSYCQQEVVGSLVTHVCSGYENEVDVSLEILSELIAQRPADMALYAVFVKGILDYMENLSPSQIRKLFCILSTLVFSRGTDSCHIQDDMHIVIRKQLSSTVAKYKRIGIIGAVMVVGSMAAVRTMTDNPDCDQMLISKECCRQAISLLELVRSCSESSPEASALYYDELANLVQTGKLDPQVQEWIGKTVLEDFQEDFIVDQGPELKGTFPFPPLLMYNLDEDDNEEGIAVNLLPLLAEDILQKSHQWNPPGQSTKKRVSPLCLASFFRLLRFCEERQYEGDLEEIDALLGCPLILTDVGVVDKMESLSKLEKDFLCTLLFYTINWFREVVNAFCRQKDPEMKGKVMIRLQNITYLQTVLERCLAATSSFIPPLAHFDSETLEAASIPPCIALPTKKGSKDSTSQKKKAKNRKNSSGDSTQFEDGGEAEETPQDKDLKEKEDVKSDLGLDSYRAYFRELDIEVLNVLKSGLLTRSLLDSEEHTKVTEVLQLGPVELAFLLEDLSRKLEYSLSISSAKRAPFLKAKVDKHVGFSHIKQRSPSEIVAFCIHLLPALCSHLESTHNYFQELATENQGVVDAPGLDVKEQQLKSVCYHSLLQTLHTLFSWSEFTQHENRKLLKSALGVLAQRLKEDEIKLGLEELVKNSFRYLINFRSTLPSISLGLTLSHLLIVVSEFGPSTHYQQQIASLTRGFLCQEWVLPNGEKEKGNKYNETLQNLLSIYFTHTEDVLKAIEEIAGVGVPELINASKDGCSKTFPTMNRQTFVVFYRAMMMVLEKTVRKIPVGKQDDSSELKAEKLCTWTLAMRDFHILVNLVKIFDSRVVLGVGLKYGRLFVEAFLKQGMPLLDYSFKKHKEDVQSLLKTFQLSTRQLHHMCGHSKIRQDTGLTNHVPLLKKSLEQFVYRVKAMLALNNCQEAFWLGNLKNRDLQGEEILSQNANESESEEDEAPSNSGAGEDEDKENKQDSEKRQEEDEDDEEEEEADSD